VPIQFNKLDLDKSIRSSGRRIDFDVEANPPVIRRCRRQSPEFPRK
jgi:hypothetical protein